MKILSLKLRDDIFEDAEQMVHKIHVSRNAYINQALDFYNQINRRKLLRKKLAKESKLTRAVSLEVLGEMEMLDDGNGL